MVVNNLDIKIYFLMNVWLMNGEDGIVNFNKWIEIYLYERKINIYI